MVLKRTKQEFSNFRYGFLNLFVFLQFETYFIINPLIINMLFLFPTIIY